MNKEIDAGIKDPLVDITSFEDKTLGEGFGIDLDSSITSHTGNVVHQNMIKRCDFVSGLITAPII
jgi:transcription initiation factor TFIIH subunit 1